MVRKLPPVDLLVRTRKATLAYKAQLLQASIQVDDGKVVLVCTKNPAKLITDLQTITKTRYFSVKFREGMFYIIKWGIFCRVK